MLLPIMPTFYPPLYTDDRDLFIYSGGTGMPGPAGPQGEPGPQGPRGEPGPAGTVNPLHTSVTAISITLDNEVDYIGVNSDGPVTITLPPNTFDGNWVIVKVEMPAPIGVKKVTINTSDGTLIDGVTSRTLQQPYERMQLLFRGQAWHVI